MLTFPSLGSGSEAQPAARTGTAPPQDPRAKWRRRDSGGNQAAAASTAERTATGVSDSSADQSALTAAFSHGKPSQSGRHLHSRSCPFLLWTHGGPIERREQRPPPPVLASSRGRLPPSAGWLRSRHVGCYAARVRRAGGRRWGEEAGGPPPSSLTGARSLAGREGASAAPRRFTSPRSPLPPGRGCARGSRQSVRSSAAPREAEPRPVRPLRPVAVRRGGEGEAGGWGRPPPSPRGSSVLFSPDSFSPLLPPLPRPGRCSTMRRSPLRRGAGRLLSLLPRLRLGRALRENWGGGGERRLRSRFSIPIPRRGGGCADAARARASAARVPVRARPRRRVGGRAGRQRRERAAPAPLPSALRLGPGRGCYMKVKAAAGALGAPGWGDEGCCEPRLWAVTPTPLPQVRAQVAAGGERLCPVPFWVVVGGLCACSPSGLPLRKNGRAAPLWRRGCGGCVELERGES